MNDKEEVKTELIEDTEQESLDLTTIVDLPITKKASVKLIKELKALKEAQAEPTEAASKKSTPSFIKEFNIAFEEELDDIYDVIEGCRTVEEPVAEVIGHSFNKKPHILNNLYLKMSYNFECERQFINAIRMYNNAKPSSSLL